MASTQVTSIFCGHVVDVRSLPELDTAKISILIPNNMLLVLASMLHILLQQQQILSYLLLLVLKIRKHKLRRLRKFKQCLKERKRRKYVPVRGKVRANSVETYLKGIQKQRNRESSYVSTSSLYDITGLEDEEFAPIWEAIRPELTRGYSGGNSVARALTPRSSLLLMLYYLRHRCVSQHLALSSSLQH